MARSPDPRRLLLALALAAGCVDAHAAPSPEEKAARKQAREAKRKQKTDATDAKKNDAKKIVAKAAVAKKTDATDGPPLPPCPPDNPLTWRSFGAGFLLTWCTGCHSSSLAADARQDAPVDIDFDTHAAYKPLARLVYDRAVLETHKLATDPNSASPMPPAGVPPEADRRRLAQFIACGSPLP